MRFNPDMPGLLKVLREDEEKVFRALLNGEVATNDLVRSMRNKADGLSRGDVTRILNRLKEMGVAEREDDYTMGPLREIWRAAMEESGFKRIMSRRILRSLLDDWPEAMDEAREMTKGAERVEH